MARGDDYISGGERVLLYKQQRDGMIGSARDGGYGWMVRVACLSGLRMYVWESRQFLVQCWMGIEIVKLGHWRKWERQEDGACCSAIRIWLLMASEPVARPVKMATSGVR